MVFIHFMCADTPLPSPLSLATVFKAVCSVMYRVLPHHIARSTLRGFMMRIFVTTCVCIFASHASKAPPALLLFVAHAIVARHINHCAANYVLTRAAGTPPPASNTPIGATIGRHFLLYTGLAPGNVYVYYPPDPSAPSPSGKPVVTCDGTHLGGVNAGIVITILLCIATLVFAVWNWRMLRGSSKAGATPAYSAMQDL